MSHGSTVPKERCEGSGKSIEEWHRCYRTAQNTTAQSDPREGEGHHQQCPLAHPGIRVNESVLRGSVKEAQVPSETSYVRAEKDGALLMAFSLVAASECDEICQIKHMSGSHALQEICIITSNSRTLMYRAIPPRRKVIVPGSSWTDITYWTENVALNSKLFNGNWSKGWRVAVEALDEEVPLGPFHFLEVRTTVFLPRETGYMKGGRFEERATVDRGKGGCWGC
ncbi:hypothetical protein GOBAR_AA02435 [Gossypium barbadense]|uniref:Uncharacterized protein n=1 Tax=Gossypium barbadense TaxID=3634 RepID=A0A2P5YRA8_GOSBA|nr:hypothetical protein GOBAR_AA02435 [Gossypium barbadense]